MMNSLQPSVVICIPTFNQKEVYFEECIKSALEQSYDNLRVLVSVNGGDQTADKILAKFKSDKLIIIRPTEHLEMSANFDFCLSQATADYISFLCSDDIMLPDCISNLVQTMTLFPEAGFVFGNLVRSEKLPSSELELRRLAIRSASTAGYYSSAAAKDLLFPWKMESSWITACLIRRSQITDQHVFSNSPFLVWGDMWLALLLIQKGGLAVSDELTGFYRQRATGEMTAYSNRMLFDFCDLITCRRLKIPHINFRWSKKLTVFFKQVMERLVPNFLIFAYILAKSKPTKTGLAMALKCESLGYLDRLILKAHRMFQSKQI
jgi:glycosyltransferase involved in cell wall biosynthesis